MYLFQGCSIYTIVYRINTMILLLKFDKIRKKKTVLEKTVTKKTRQSNFVFDVLLLYEIHGFVSYIRIAIG